MTQTFSGSNVPSSKATTPAIGPQDFRLDDPAIQADPYPYYPLLREQAPVLESRLGTKPCWIVSRRKDVDTVLMNPAVYSSRTTPIPNLLFADPPHHTRLRKMVNAMFIRTAVAGMEERITAYAEGLVAPIVAAGRCDAVTDLAGPLTISVISLTLGIDVPHVETLRNLTHLRAEAVLAMRMGTTPSERGQRASEELLAFMSGLVDSGDYHDDGVIAVLADLLSKGELTRDEFVAFAVLLFAAGHTTTTNLIASAIHVLAQRPDYFERLRTDPAFIEPFVEETLRTRPSFHRLLRITTQDVRLNEVEIPAGSLIIVLVASANRDPDYFESAEEFDPDQKHRAHIAFGRGIHTCLGNWLARLEAASAIKVLARHVSAISLDPDRPAVPLTGGTFNEFGFERLPILVRPETALP